MLFNVLTLATMVAGFTVVASRNAFTNPETEDYEVVDNEARYIDKDYSDEVRCYCNQPDCVRQGYMCRGRKGCFTEIPLSANVPLLKAEHNAHSGCLDESYKSHKCPTGFLCCSQDLCNHVDNPAMKSRLNKTLQELAGDQRAYLAPLHPNSQERQTDNFFSTVAIVVGIIGLIILLIIVVIGIRCLEPIQSQNGNKYVSHPDNGPPLLGPPKVPLV